MEKGIVIDVGERLSLGEIALVPIDGWVVTAIESAPRDKERVEGTGAAAAGGGSVEAEATRVAG